MNQKEQAQQIAQSITKEAADNGLLIETGWLAFKRVCYPDGMVPDQEEQLRNAFFAGSQHLYGSVLAMMDPGSEETENDLKKMQLLDAELEGFLIEFRRKHNLQDED